MRLLPCFLALMLFAPDAHAWGLETHVFFAQWLLGALPFADRELRKVAARLPGLVLAGACLPDLALAGKALGLVAFHHVHGALVIGPGAAIRAQEALLADFVARAFRCGEPVAARALGLLGRADRALRASPLPRLCRHAVARFYRDPAYRFEGYLARVKLRLGDVELALAGRFVDWVSSDPEGRRGDGEADERAGGHIARVVQAENDARNGG